MIYNYPFYGYSRRYYRYPSHSSQSFQQSYPQSVTNKRDSYPHNLQSQFNTSNRTNPNKTNVHEENDMQEERKNSSENVFFELFGIKLYFDDILLICLIFFLYNEGVQDQYLFIVLILLLLS